MENASTTATQLSRLECIPVFGDDNSENRRNGFLFVTSHGNPARDAAKMDAQKRIQAKKITRLILLIAIINNSAVSLHTVFAVRKNCHTEVNQGQWCAVGFIGYAVRNLCFGTRCC
jgi:hypothetical protein